MELRRPSSVAELDRRATVCYSPGEPRWCRCSGPASSRRTSSSTSAASCRAASTDATIGAGTTLAEIEASTTVPEALREACRLAASPQLRNAGTLAGNLLQSTRCWYWRLQWPCRLHGGDTCFARAGEHREHAVFANDYCASAHPSDVAAALLALDASSAPTARELPLGELYRVPTQDDRRTTTLGPGELILSVDVPPCDRVGLSEGDGAQAVGVPARRRRRRAERRDDAGRARRRRADPVAARRHGLDDATPLPGNAYKLEIAAALVKRATAQRRCLKHARAPSLVVALAAGGARGFAAAAARSSRPRRRPLDAHGCTAGRRAAADRAGSESKPTHERSTRRRRTTSPSTPTAARSRSASP